MGGESNDGAVALAALAHLGLFECERYQAKLTARACALRFRAVQTGTSESFDSDRCRGCELGAKHAAELPAEPKSTPTRRRRKAPRTQAAVAEAQARKARRAAAEAPPDPEPAPAAPASSTARWCSPAEAARPRRPRGAPVPSPPGEAEAWRDALRADPAELERVVALVLDRVHGTPLAPLMARAALLRRLGCFEVQTMLVDALRPYAGAVELKPEVVSNWIDRGRGVVVDAMRQLHIGDDGHELDDIRGHIVAIMAAGRADAGEPRFDRRGPRQREEREAIEPAFPLFELDEVGT